MSKYSGKVYLVGAGPGDIAYLTLKGQQLLSQAEVLIYDALVDAQMLELVPSNCLKLDVGKRGGQPSTPQARINQLLVSYCQLGKQVVRLKSGDPLIFGRANPEIQALKKADCNFELVPGISSALAAPLLAGIPLTDKDLSKTFAIASAHQPEALDWEALARLDTLVFLMGGRSLAQITRQLLRQGRSPQEPIAIIRHCSLREQQIWTGSLVNIVEQTADISLSPAIIVIGKVVTLAHAPCPMPDAQCPLSRKTILVTRAAEQASKFAQLLQHQGATVLEMPALEITPPSSWNALDRSLSTLADFDWLLLTSANAVNYFFERLTTVGKDARALAGIKIAVVGKKTAAVLKQHGLQPDFIPPNFVADSLGEHFPESLVNQKVLFPRVETGGREVLVKELSSQGAQVVEVAAYQSQCPAQIVPEVWEALQQGEIDIVTFASAKTVKNFHQLIESVGASSDITVQSLLNNVWIASIGPQTSKSCHQLLGRVDIEAQEYTLEGLTEAIIEQTTKNA